MLLRQSTHWNAPSCQQLSVIHSLSAYGVTQVCAVSAYVGTLPAMATLLNLPHDVYADMLECHLLLSCCAALMRQQGLQPCTSLGMMARNDRFFYAKEEPDEESYDAHVSYSVQLSQRIGAKIAAITPPPLSLTCHQHSQAEL